MSKENAYAGKIQSGGTQYVPAPYQSEKAHKGTVKVSGSDLRDGTGKKSGK